MSSSLRHLAGPATLKKVGLKQDQRISKKSIIPTIVFFSYNTETSHKITTTASSTRKLHTPIMQNSFNEQQAEGILWSCITRNSTILVEAGEDNFDGQVTKLAQAILAKKPTPGYEYASQFRSPLKAIKFHVYERSDESLMQSSFTKNRNDCFIIWAFSCVYDSRVVQKDQAQSFLEKICGLTQIQRDEEYRWRQGDQLAAQECFAEVLLQRMEEVTYMGRAAMVNDQINSVKEQMGKNIDLILERGEKLEDLQQEANRLEEMSRSFKKGAKKLRRVQMWQNAKYGLVVGSAVTAGVAVIVVPPLVALL